VPIEQIRIVLFVALGLVLFLLWQAWQRDYGVQEGRAPQTTPPVTQSAQGPKDIPDVPTQARAKEAAPSLPESSVITKGDVVRVRTDVLDAEINTLGGNLIRLALLQYPVSAEEPNTPFTLFSATPPNLFIAQTGLLGPEATPDHHATFEAEQSAYVLDEDEDHVDVPLQWTSPEGVKVSKIYTFQRGSYVVGVHYRVDNESNTPWSGRIYAQFQRSEPPQKRRLGFVYTYTGGVLSTGQDPYQKIDFGEIAKRDLEASAEGGWVAMIQHYFAAAWIPDQAALNHYYTKSLIGPRYVIGVILPEVTVLPADSNVLAIDLYAGPKVQDRLEHVAPYLNRTVDYGWLWFIAQPLFWLLEFIHGVVGNWGWSIIILTVLIKLSFFQLSATSYKSMARMRKLQPRLMSLRDRYKDDKMRLNQAMMDLYKKEKINPLGGCLPIAVQIPVFIALYWVLLESIELRQASFMFWIDDLSTYDSYHILPILMGITMFLQQRLNPTPPDPLQAKIMMALPFVFTFFFLFFPAGLVLYWLVNNVLSIAQQWVITKRIAPETT
jgi:YidC/Oxa1 family membrane protein insertase